MFKFLGQDKKTQTWESFQQHHDNVVHTTELWFWVRYGQDIGL